MTKIEKKLSQLDVSTLLQIKSGLLSIYRVNTDDNSFQELVKNDNQLSDTCYIACYNDNKTTDVLFLNKAGKIIKKDIININKLIFLPLNLEIGYRCANEKSDVLKEYSQYSINFM